MFAGSCWNSGSQSEVFEEPLSGGYVGYCVCARGIDAASPTRGEHGLPEGRELARLSCLLACCMRGNLFDGFQVNEKEGKGMGGDQ